MIHQSVSKNYGFNFFQALTIVRAILVNYFSQHGEIPKTAEDIDKTFTIVESDLESLAKSLEFVARTSGATVPLTMEELGHLVDTCINTTLESISKEKTALHFIKEILTHSIKHYVLISAMILLGVDDKDIRGHYERGGVDIYLYDNLPDGNGCCETLSQMMKIQLKERIQALRDAIEKDIAVTLPSKDFYSILEELICGCKS